MEETDLFEEITKLDSELIIELISIRNGKKILVNSTAKMDKKLLNKILKLVEKRDANLIINTYGSLEITF